MVTDQKPVVESGVQNLSMAHGALTVPGSSYSMTPVTSFHLKMACHQVKLAAAQAHGCW